MVCVEAQTTLGAVDSDPITVNFLNGYVSEDDDENLPICFHFQNKQVFARSPRIPVRVEGIRVPMLMDTGAEVTIVSTAFVRHLFPDAPLPSHGREVRSLAGTRTALRGPISLEIQLCGLNFSHPVYFCENVHTFLLGYDVISTAGLVIDAESRQVWSKFAATWSDAQSFTSPTDPVSSDPSIPVPSLDSTTVEAVSATPLHCGQAPCESERPSSDCFASASSICVITALDDTARVSAHCVPTAHCNGVSTALDPFAPMFVPRSVASVLSSPPPPPCCCRLNHSVRPVPADDAHAFCTDQSVAVESLPLVGTFSQENETEILGNEQTQVKSSPELDISDIELPEHVDVLYIETLENVDFPQEITDGLKQVLYDHRETFAKSSADLGFCPIIKHDIDTGSARPIKQSPRLPPISAREAEDEILDEMLATGVIEPSHSEWASPVCLVKKKDGTFRFCVDYRRVNAVSRKDAFPVPDIQDALDNLRGARYFITADLLSGYWQLGLTDRAKERSAFCTRRGLFQFTRMAFGLCGAPSSFCSLVQIVLRVLLWDICLCYLDDIVIFALQRPLVI